MPLVHMSGSSLPSERHSLNTWVLGIQLCVQLGHRSLLPPLPPPSPLPLALVFDLWCILKGLLLKTKEG